MITNEGTTDRAIRAVLGIVLLALAFLTLAGTLKIIALVLGAVMLITAAVGFCPLYRLMGVTTCAVKP